MVGNRYNSLQGLVLSFYHLSSGNWIQIVRFVNKHLYPLSYFASQLVTVFVAVTKYPWCETKLFLGRCNTHIYSPQVANSWRIKVQFLSKSNLVSLICVPYRCMGEGLLTGAEMTQRQLHHWGSSQHGWQLIKIGNQEPTVQPAGSPTVWRVSCPGGSVDQNLFEAAALVSVFFFAVRLVSESSCSLALLFWEGPSAFIAHPGRERYSESLQSLVNLLSFGDTLKPFWVVCLPASCRVRCFIAQRSTATMGGSEVQHGTQFHQGGGGGLTEAVAWQELVLEALHLLVGHLLQPSSSLHHECILRVLQLSQTPPPAWLKGSNTRACGNISL